MAEYEKENAREQTESSDITGTSVDLNPDYLEYVVHNRFSTSSTCSANFTNLFSLRF
jgi:hypothetical protein